MNVMYRTMPWTIPLARGALAVAFIAAAIGKMRDVESFRRLSETITFLPPAARSALPMVIPGCELVAAMLLLVPEYSSLGAFVSTGLLVVFTSFLLVQRALPFVPFCHCFGVLRLASDARTENTISLARNAVLLILSLFATRRDWRWRCKSLHDDAPAPEGGHRGPSCSVIARRGGFTLVEAIVSIAVLLILLALLAPVLARARARAATTVCMSHLRQIGTLATIWSQQHQGFLPLDGTVYFARHLAGYGSLSRALADWEHRRYAYYVDRARPSALPTVERPMPFFVALLASSLNTSQLEGLVSDETWSITEARLRSADIFRCPAAVPVRYLSRSAGWIEGAYEGGPTMDLIIGDTNYAALVWNTNIDYGSNGGLLGFVDLPGYSHRAYRGRVAAARHASRMVLCSESGGRIMGYKPALDRPTRRVTLADALDATPEVPDAPPADLKRHGGSANVLFLDGHVETVRLADAELDHCELLQE